MVSYVISLFFLFKLISLFRGFSVCPFLFCMLYYCLDEAGKKSLTGNRGFFQKDLLEKQMAAQEIKNGEVKQRE